MSGPSGSVRGRSHGIVELGFALCYGIELILVWKLGEDVRMVGG
jgi:hypothetical protein